MFTFSNGGFFPMHPSSSCFQPIVNFNAVIASHGIDYFDVGNLLLALPVFSFLVDCFLRKSVLCMKLTTRTPQEIMPNVSTTSGLIQQLTRLSHLEKQKILTSCFLTMTSFPPRPATCGKNSPPESDRRLCFERLLMQLTDCPIVCKPAGVLNLDLHSPN